MQNKFTQKAQNTLNNALTAACELGHSYIGSEHILLGLLLEKDSIAFRILQTRGADEKKFRSSVIDVSGIGSRSNVTPSDMTPRAKKIIESAASESTRCGTHFIGTEHILYAILSERDCVAVRLLEAEGIPASELVSDLNAYIGTSSRRDKHTSKQDTRSSSDDRTKIKGAPTLSAYGKDLTAAAREGRLDPTVGRDKETERVIRILSRRTKNNPCLVGEPGVGKTAVVEGLAVRIINGRVPDDLADKRIITLNISSMIAGAKYRGEFEDRMKNVMEEVEKCDDIILFIDEIHVIIGAGAAEGAVDAANIIKPALARSGLQVIGATTLSEYRSRIEKDPALERRFQSVMINEPTEDEAIEILRGLRQKYEEHHSLSISDEAITAAVKLSARYIPDRFLPDKAIDLIDEAASMVRISKDAPDSSISDIKNRLSLLAAEKEKAVECQNFELAAGMRDRESALLRKLEEEKERIVTRSSSRELIVTKENVADVVTSWTGIPVSRILEDEGKRLLTLESALSKRIIGQSEAVETICRAIHRGRVGLKNPKRPIGSFIFVGQTGVGKTELSIALANELFGSDGALIRLDMSEYMEKHSVSRLIGSPPGYVGYEDGGQLTERIRRRPYSVVLLDEIEKAHPDVFNILLQVLEDGSLTDSQGRRADFSNAIVIMTSNIGTDIRSQRRVLGFSDVSNEDAYAVAKKGMTAELKKHFRPEFLNRVDEIVYFNPLTEDNIKTIADKMLSEIEERAAAIEIDLKFDDSVASFVIKDFFDPAYGARGLRRRLTVCVEDPLSEEILNGSIKNGDKVIASARDGRLIFSEL